MPSLPSSPGHDDSDSSHPYAHHYPLTASTALVVSIAPKPQLYSSYYISRLQQPTAPPRSPHPPKRPSQPPPMGNDQSTQISGTSSAWGFQVLRNTNPSIAIEPWFDFILGINGRQIVRASPSQVAWLREYGRRWMWANVCWWGVYRIMAIRCSSSRRYGTAPGRALH